MQPQNGIFVLDRKVYFVLFIMQARQTPIRTEVNRISIKSERIEE